MSGLPEGFEEWSGKKQLRWFGTADGQAFIALQRAKREAEVPLNLAQQEEVVAELAAVDTYVQEPHAVAAHRPRR